MLAAMEPATTHFRSRGLPSVALIGLAWSACARTPAPPPAAPAPPAPIDGPRFDTSGALEPPRDYRSWVFLTSGFAMSYGPAAQVAAAGGVDVLDNVYLTPSAYRQFLSTGVWPEGTMFVLEIRNAEETGSIVTRGRYQTELVAIEAAVKDTRRWPGGWGYFDFPIDGSGPRGPATVLPKSAACYSCHASHGAVEQTFTQFYPTLFAVAREKGTVRPDFAGLPPTASELAAKIAAGGWPAGQAMLEQTAIRWPRATVLREPILNRVVRQLRNGKRTAEATALLEDITRRFPASPNAWDNLAEIYESTGAPSKAREASARGLAALAEAPLSPNRRASLERALKERQKRLMR
jgi:hypothetical protein